ncbi:MAG: mandelate racemase/muconate lactonizing enzyme family protein [Fusobacterium varium]|uniref:mandelate racemase/muconate lactonizing enzyme family protein n=1 Tax=Fusobacterium varium TaxID=856 RepID=UPI000E40F76E|nr:mandelate racemase/muconate lactonizing enzyme family protein [Fusobacterium varium]MCI6032147.1 mandelate racemase/muconate lactonizing enzyme family protein [Fusobacterium varium]RGJ30124.1 mandelate racemase/muconate lactonizing enzyme family protein [Fusobacterium varium]
MKIVKVDVMQLGTDVRPDWRPIVCRIYTDEGIYGDGEAAMAYDVGALGAFGMLQELAKMVIGMDPLDNEVIWDKLYRSTFWGQNGGPVTFSAISAIDIALWDIKGKYFKVPVYKLLGGKKRDNLRCYASQLQFGWGEVRIPARTPEDYAKNAKKAVAEGYDAVKFDFFLYDEKDGFFNDNDRLGLLSKKYLNIVEKRIAAVREAVGPDVDIIMENHSYTDAQSALQLGKMAEKYDIFCFEEPTTPYPKITKYMSDKLNIPIATGERIYSRWQYAQYFENCSVQMIQPDFGNCGGITEGKKICDMAYAYDVGVQGHACGSPLSNVVALHLECVIPNFVIHEHHAVNLTPYNKSYCIYDYQPVNGKFKVPELPGLGNELSESAINNSVKVTIE